jgi:hypothetical protein
MYIHRRIVAVLGMMSRVKVLLGEYVHRIPRQNGHADDGKGDIDNDSCAEAHAGDRVELIANEVLGLMVHDRNRKISDDSLDDDENNGNRDVFHTWIAGRDRLINERRLEET